MAATAAFSAQSYAGTFYIVGSPNFGYVFLLKPGYPAAALDLLSMLSARRKDNSAYFVDQFNLQGLKIFDDGVAAVSLPQGIANSYAAYLRDHLGMLQMV